MTLQDKADALEKVREARFEYKYTKKNAVADVKREVELRTKAATTALSYALQEARKQGVEWKYLFEAMGTKDSRTVNKFLKFAKPDIEEAVDNFDTELSDLKNRYPEHFDEWLQRVKAEAVADFASDPRHAELVRVGVPFDLTTYKTLGLV